MGMWLLPAVISLCAVAVNALAPCNQTIIDTLSECYVRGVPNQELGGDYRGTLIQTSTRVLPKDTRCVTLYEKDNMAHVSLFLYTKDPDHYKEIRAEYKLERMQDHILETDSKGNKYRRYVIHYYHGLYYSYYRCIDCDAKVSGKPEVGFVVGCGDENDGRVIQDTSRVKMCFRQLGIARGRSVKPCVCPHDTKHYF